MKKQQILEEIDLTLKSLEEHTRLLNSPSIHLTELELDALQKSHESLLARLIHRDHLLQSIKKISRKE